MPTFLTVRKFLSLIFDERVQASTWLKTFNVANSKNSPEIYTQSDSVDSNHPSFPFVPFTVVYLSPRQGSETGTGQVKSVSKVREPHVLVIRMVVSNSRSVWTKWDVDTTKSRITTAFLFLLLFFQVKLNDLDFSCFLSARFNFERS